MKKNLFLIIALIGLGSIIAPHTAYALNQDEQKMILIASGPVAFTCYKLGKWAQNSPTGLKTVKLLSKFVGALATAIGAIHLAHEYAHASDTANPAATAYAIGSFILGLSSCSLGYSLANDYVEGVSEFCASLQEQVQQK